MIISFIFFASISGPATVKEMAIGIDGVITDGQDILVGVINSGIDCGEPTDFTFSTSVYPNRDWIEKTMNNK